MPQGAFSCTLAAMPADPTPIPLFGTSHLGALTVTAVFLLTWIALGRGQLMLARKVEIGVAVMLLSLYPVGWCLAMSRHFLSIDSFLPLHLCDWAGIACGVALLTHHRLAVECCYFWGLAGTLNGLITPNLQHDFPDVNYFRFFALHSGVVATALYLTIGKRLWPRPGAVFRAVVATEIYVVIAGTMDWITGSNYGFLHHLPEQHSLLHHLGPHPIYVLWLQPVGIAFFLVLYAPFWLLRRKRRL